MAADDVIRIASFDPAKRNLAQYVEETSLAVLGELEEEYSKLPKHLQRRARGTMNDDIQGMLDKICQSGTRIHSGVFDISGEDPKKYSIEARLKLVAHMERFRWLWDTCQDFIIEQQFFRTTHVRGRSGGTEANVDAIKVAEGIMIWLLMNYPDRRIIYFGSQFKTQILGAPGKMNKSQRKAWAVKKAREIYGSRDDTDALALYELKDIIFRKRINTEEKIQHYLSFFTGEGADVKKLAEKIVRSRQKLDDVDDCCIQTQAYKFRHYVSKF